MKRIAITFDLELMPTFPIRRAVVRNEKIVGLVEDDYGVMISIQVAPDRPVCRGYITNSFDEVSEFMCS